MPFLRSFFAMKMNDGSQYSVVRGPQSSGTGLEPPLMDKELVFLIGYRGVGKTTVARLLAEQLRWKWVDADAALEERHRRTLADIFADEGEAGFRDKEEALLEELCRLRQYVIATGGGAILRTSNRERLQSTGLVVWLTADAETIRRRIEADTSTRARRPVLTVGGLAEIEDLLRLREPLYRACADWTVEASNRAPAEIAMEIASLLESASGW
jgi:shikimate kinase